MGQSSRLPEETHSFWMETGKVKSYQKLKENYTIDTAVIGGGIAGILTAYTLAEAGKDVALFEGRKLLSGTTGNTTAKLSAQHQLIYDELINRYGELRAQLFYEANMEGIEYIKEIAKNHRLEKEINDRNAYVYTQDASKKDKFEKEADAYNQLNIPGRWLSEFPIDLDIEAALEMNHQAEFHPVLFLHGVLEASEGLKDRIFEHTLIDEVIRDDEGSLHLKTADDNRIVCNHAIFATHYPTFEPDKHFTKMKPEISYALAYKTNEERLEGMYINDDFPKKTFREMQSGDENYLLVGGQSHPLGDDYAEMSRYEEIDRFAKETFGVGDPVYRWSSHDMITKDRIPFIGQLHPDYPNVFTATGFSKWGLADAATGARLLADLVLGNENRYAGMYDPRRDIPDLEETTSASSQKDDESDVEDLVLPDKTADLQVNEATIIEKDDGRTGVYKDENGQLHYMDLSCTHLGCDLQWNNGDKTWDCPCHGSRFNAYGEVIEGPALADLENK